MKRMTIQVYVDLDGVLADFDTHYEKLFGIRPDKAADNVDWEKIKTVPAFYASMPPMPDHLELWTFVSQLRPKPIVLTGVPSSIPDAADQKRRWVKYYLGAETEVIACRSRDKSLVLKDAPGGILIDDWHKYRDLWLAAGGRWITHVSAEKSIDELLEMGIGL